MVHQRQKLGRQGEALAAAHLRKQGYRILERNFRNAVGEIDIIAREAETIVFVEVKTRRSDRFGPPAAALTPRKIRQMSMVALSYLKRTGRQDAKARFDVVAVKQSPAGYSIELIQNAFELAYP
jgi:putative endonuclease